MITADAPLVSVIIPTYNRADTLLRSLDSVLSQTYSNIEVLVVDDGSTDDTEALVTGINDTRVIYIKNPSNLGPAGARNRGAALAAGDIIAFQDSDDEWPADKLEKQLPLLLEDPSVQMVYCRIERYKGEKLLDITPSNSLSLDQKQGYLLVSLLDRPLISTQTIVVWKALFLEMGGFREFLYAFEDYEFSVRFAKKHRIAFADDTFVKVYVSSDSVNRHYSAVIKADMYIIEEAIEHLRQHDLLVKRIALVLKRAFLTGCDEVFSSELTKRWHLFDPDEQKEIQAFLQAYIQQLNMKKELHEAMQSITQMVRELHNNYLQNPAIESSALDEAVKDISAALFDCIKLLESANPALDQKVHILKEKISSGQKEQPAFLMELYSIAALAEQQAYSDLLR